MQRLRGAQLVSYAQTPALDVRSHARTQLRGPAVLRRLVELDVLGRVLAQVEPAGAHVPAPPRVRVDDEQLQAHAPERDVRHVPALRGRARARHGHRHEEDPVRPLAWFVGECVLTRTCSFHRFYLFALQVRLFLRSAVAQHG